jgi:glycosyltransferase involved in cell wall biosynthesis
MTNQDMPDIAMLVEGTYPYVRGGVSSWIHQVITGLPEFSFSLIFLGSTPSAYKEMKYKMPDNVVRIDECFLMDQESTLAPAECRGDPEVFRALEQLHRVFKKGTLAEDGEVVDANIAHLLDKKKLGARDFFYSRESWEFIQTQYFQQCPDTPFINYFWSIRSIHGPIFKIAEIAQKVPPAKVFHAISTGYAGFLGALLQHRTGHPLILTEHGIYTKERRIDIQTMNLKSGEAADIPNGIGGLAYHDNLWIRFFEALGRFTYRASDPIISLYGRNRQRQITDGAEADRTQIIPNGVDLDGLAPLRAKRPPSPPPIIGLLGRIVSIKDVKTFIRAMSTVVNRLPDAQAWLIGPTEEEPGYVEECKSLIHDLGLDQKILFLGFQDPKVILPQLGLLILSSISEAFPLVLLEAFATGLPAVTTDVGACREIIEGRDEADQALGKAGRVVAFADPEALADAAVELLADEEAWTAAQHAAIARVEAYYHQDKILGQYRDLYRNALES